MLPQRRVWQLHARPWISHPQNKAGFLSVAGTAIQQNNVVIAPRVAVAYTYPFPAFAAHKGTPTAAPKLPALRGAEPWCLAMDGPNLHQPHGPKTAVPKRSEEHTSELQSR